MKDDLGKTIKHGDRIEFRYGIPPIRAVGRIVERDGTLYVLTPGHHPVKSKLRSLRRYVGKWFKIENEI